MSTGNASLQESHVYSFRATAWEERVLPFHDKLVQRAVRPARLMLMASGLSVVSIMARPSESGSVAKDVDSVSTLFDHELSRSLWVEYSPNQIGTKVSLETNVVDYPIEGVDEPTVESTLTLSGGFLTVDHPVSAVYGDFLPPESADAFTALYGRAIDLSQLRHPGQEEPTPIVLKRSAGDNRFMGLIAVANIPLSPVAA